MAYNFLLEFQTPPDWVALNEAFSYHTDHFEAFPVRQPGADEASALAVSVPGKQACPLTCDSLCCFLQVAATRFAADIIDLYTGEAVSVSEFPALKIRLLG